MRNNTLSCRVKGKFMHEVEAFYKQLLEMPPEKIVTEALIYREMKSVIKHFDKVKLEKEEYEELLEKEHPLYDIATIMSESYDSNEKWELIEATIAEDYLDHELDPIE